MPKIKFEIPFDQHHVIRYIEKKSASIFASKLTQVNNLSTVSKEICFGLSTSYLLHENNHQGDKFINEINLALKNITPQKTIKSNRVVKDINYYTNQSLKIFSHALLNEQIADSLNKQLNYEKFHFLAIFAEKVNFFVFHKQENTQSNLDYINAIITHNQKEINKEIPLLNNNEIKESIALFYNLVKSDQFTKNFHQEFILANKIKNNEKLDFQEIKYFLSEAFFFTSQNSMHKTTAQKINAGLINNKKFDTNDPVNIFYYPEPITLAELKLEIDNTLNENQAYFALINTARHSTAVSVQKHAVSDNYTYKYFDPNHGIKTYPNEVAFFAALESLLTLNITNIEENRNENKDFVIERISMERINDNKINVQGINQQHLHNHIKKSLIDHKVKIALPNSDTLTFEKHDVETNITTVKLSNKKDTAYIEIQQNNTQELVNAVSNHLSNRDVNDK